MYLFLKEDIQNGALLQIRSQDIQGAHLFLLEQTNRVHHAVLDMRSSVLILQAMLYHLL